MDEYIDREALYDALNTQGKTRLNVGDVLDFIAAMPADDVAPVVHAHWEFGEFDGIGRTVRCSNCGGRDLCANKKVWQAYEKHQYCGKCGAKMDEVTGK